MSLLVQSEVASDGVTRLTLIDLARAAWTSKGKAKRRAQVAPAWVLQVDTRREHRYLRETHAFEAYFGVLAVYRTPRALFWQAGGWGKVDPLRGSGGYLFSGHLDERTGAFVDYWTAAGRGGPPLIARRPEEDQVALDTLVALYLKGAPPPGVYALDGLL